MEIDRSKKYKTFLGSYRTIRQEAFFLKFLALGIITSVFLSRNMHLMLSVLALILVGSLFLLGKDTFRIFRFLILSTLVLAIIWILFVEKIWQAHTPFQGLESVFTSFEYRNALIRLYGLFMGGQLFLGVTAQHELLTDLRKYRVPVSMMMAVVLMFNSVAYFIQFYGDIKTSYTMRCRKRNPFQSNYYIFTSLALEAMYLISNCKKIYFLDADRIISSLTQTELPQKGRSVKPESLSVRIENLIYFETDKPVLKHLEAEFHSDGIYVIEGKNGIGKSTLLDAMAGIIPAVIRAEGEIQVAVDGKTAEGRIGYVPQGVERALLFDTPASMLNHISKEKVQTWLERFSISGINLETRNIGELSSGECKKFELIAELLNPNHDVLLLDEPTAFLDELSKKVLYELLEQVKKEKIILVISHDNFFEKYPVQWYHLTEKGMQREDPGCSENEPHDLTDWEKLLSEEMMKGFGKRQNVWKCSIAIPEMTGLSNSAADSRIDLENGKNIVILGKNGSGKTTLDQAVFQEVLSQHKELKCLMIRQEMNKQFFALSCAEEMLLGIPKTQEAEKRAMELLKTAGLDAWAEFPPYFLSGGQKRFLLILCLMMQTPDIMIMDEPFNSLDRRNRKQLVQLLTAYQKQTGVCYLLSDQTNEYFEEMTDEKIILEKTG